MRTSTTAIRTVIPGRMLLGNDVAEGQPVKYWVFFTRSIHTIKKIEKSFQSFKLGNKKISTKQQL